MTTACKEGSAHKHDDTLFIADGCTAHKRYRAAIATLSTPNSLRVLHAACRCHSGDSSCAELQARDNPFEAGAAAGTLYFVVAVGVSAGAAVILSRRATDLT